MKFSFLVHQPLDRGSGVGGTTLFLADVLREHGHTVETHGLELSAPHEGLIAQLLFPWRVRAWIRDTAVDGTYQVIETSSGDLWSTSRRLLRRTSALVVVRSHGLEHLAVRARREGARKGEIRLRWRYRLYHGGWRLWEVRRSFTKADVVIVPNATESELLVRKWRIAPSKILISPPPAGTNFAVDHERQGTGTRVLVAGGNQWRKGSTEHVGIVREILARRDDVSVTWMGLRNLNEIGIELPESSAHRLATYDPQSGELMGSLLDRHDVLLMKTRFEGFGLLLLEAMSHGVVVVTSDVPGPRDIVIEGAGFLSDVGDEKLTLEQIERACEPETQGRMSRAAVVHARSFRPELIVGDYLALLLARQKER